MSKEADETPGGDDEAAASSAVCPGVDQPPCGTQTGEILDSSIDGTENQLRAMRLELDQCKEENKTLQVQLKKYVDAQRDPLGEPEVVRLIQQYKCQVEELRQKNQAFRQGPNSRIAEEHAEFQKRNIILLQMNGHLAQNSADLKKEVLEYKNKIELLKEQLASMQISSPEHPGEVEPQVGIQGAPVGDNEESIPTEPVAVAGDQAPSGGAEEEKERTRYWMQQLLNLVRSYQKKDRELEQEVLSLTEKNMRKDEEMKRLLAQMELVVKERDDLLGETRKLDRVETVVVNPLDMEAQGTSMTSPPSSMYLEHYTGLVVQLQGKVEELNVGVLQRDDHIQDQEEKIQKLHAIIGDLTEQRDELKEKFENAARRRVSASAGSCNEKFTTDYSEVVKDNQRKSNSILELAKKNEVLTNEMKALKVELTLVVEQNENMTKQLEDKNKTEHVSPEVYEVQLKAFQDDWKAEHEEKAKLMQDNQNLRLELEKMQGFTSPPRSYEPGNPQSPPPLHRMPSDQMSSLPNSGAPGYPPAPGHSYLRSNTIPPRNAFRSTQAYDRSISQNHDYYPSHPANFPPDHVTHPLMQPGRNHVATRPAEAGHGEPSHSYQHNWQPR